MSNAEDAFLFYLRTLAPDVPIPEREYAFAKPRKFAFDFCWHDDMTAVEIQGGTWKKGAHSSGVGLQRDYTKNNLAVIHGWKVLYFTPQMLQRNPAACIDQVRELVRLPFAEPMEAI